MTDSFETLLNPDIPLGEQVWQALRKSELKVLSLFVRREKLRTIPVPRDEFVRQVTEIDGKHEHVVNWINEILQRRNDITPVFIFKGKSKQFEFGLQVPQTSEGLPSLILELDYTRNVDALTQQINDSLLGFDGQVKSTFRIPCKNAYYLLNGKSISVRGLQPPSHQNTIIDVQVANFQRDEFSPDLFDNITITGSAGKKRLSLPERTDETGIEITLHELGHQWANYLSLDNLSPEQMVFRRGNSGGTELNSVTQPKSRASVHAEISVSERLASAIARVLKRKMAQEFAGLSKRGVYFQEALQSYDVATAKFALANGLSDHEMKRILAARVNRTDEGVRQIRECHEVRSDIFQQVDEFIKTLPEPHEIYDLRPLSETTARSWNFIAKETKFEITVFDEANGSIFEIVLEGNGKRKTIVVDERGIEISTGPRFQEIVQERLEPGRYEDDFVAKKIKVRTIFDQLISELQKITKQ